MYSRKQWTPWRREVRDGNPTKVLYNARTGGRASSTAPDTWTTHTNAVATAQSPQYNGIGYVVTMEDPFVVIDLDNCRDADTGVIEPWAMEIVHTFGSYAEPSAGSGTGVHIIGNGAKIHNRCRNWKHDRGTDIEVYEWGRFLTMSETPLPGFETIRDIQQPLDDFITEHWTRHIKTVDRTPLEADGGPVSLVSAEIVDKARRISPKFAPLYDYGDIAGYPGASEGDAALCALIAWYTKDPEQILEIWRSSAIMRDKVDRKDYADRTIENALDLVGSSQYDPNYRNHGHTAPPVDDGSEAVAYWKERAFKAEARAARAEDIRSHIHAILRNGDINAGSRLTAFAIAMDLNARTANGEEPAEAEAFSKNARKSYTVQAFKAPALRYADVTGHSPQTVQRHMRELEAAGLLSKHLVRVETKKDDIDEETGEIITVPGKRDVNFIALPDNDVVTLVERFATYRRPEGDTGQHGGTREARPACTDHPTAGTFTVKHEHIECAECHTVLATTEPKHTYHEPDESSHINLVPDTSTVSNSLNDTKLIPDEMDGATSPIKMVPDPIVTRCDWNLGGGETCDDPTEEWDTGYGSSNLCHHHADQIRKAGGSAPRRVVESGVYRGKASA